MLGSYCPACFITKSTAAAPERRLFSFYDSSDSKGRLLSFARYGAYSRRQDANRKLLAPRISDVLDELKRAVIAIVIEIGLVEENSALGMVPGFHVVRPAKSIEELQYLKATHGEAFRVLAGEAHSITTTSELDAFRRRYAALSVALRRVLPLPTLSAQRSVDAALVGAASHISRMNSAT